MTDQIAAEIRSAKRQIKFAVTSQHPYQINQARMEYQVARDLAERFPNEAARLNAVADAMLAYSKKLGFDIESTEVLPPVELAR